MVIFFLIFFYGRDVTGFLFQICIILFYYPFVHLECLAFHDEYKIVSTFGSGEERRAGAAIDKCAGDKFSIQVVQAYVNLTLADGREINPLAFVVKLHTLDLNGTHTLGFGQHVAASGAVLLEADIVCGEGCFHLLLLERIDRMDLSDALVGGMGE